MASQTLVLDVQLDVLNQTITYKDYIRVIPESYWTDTLVPYMYPLWDTDKDKLIMFSWYTCLLYTSPSPRDRQKSRMPSSA